MKKYILLFALALSGAMLNMANAQVNVHVNIGSQPVWGPSGYDYAEYYYFPDMDIYYHIPDREFIYFDRGNWISAYSLPPYYNNFDLYNSYKVVINEPQPFMRNDYWHSRYASYGGRQQEIIYNSRDPRYFVINEHPEHGRWMSGRQDNDRGYNNNRNVNNGRNEGIRNEERRIDNNPRNYDMGRNDRMDRGRNERITQPNDNRRSQQNQGDRRGDENGRSNGGRRN